MSKNRKEKLIEDIDNELGLIEDELINTPPEMSFDKYQERVERAKKLRQTLEMIKNL